MEAKNCIRGREVEGAIRGIYDILNMTDLSVMLKNSRIVRAHV